MKLEFLDSIPIDAPGDPILKIHSLAWADDGRVYLSDEFNHRVLIVDGNAVTVVGARGGEPGQFWYPRGLCLAGKGADRKLIVCDAWNHRIQRFAPSGEFIDSFGSIGDGDDRFHEPVAVIGDDD